MRGATILEGPLLHFVVISIHAPNAGSDRQDAYRGHFDVDFNPRSPRGERHRHGSVLHDPRDFNPRSPCGERPWLLCRHPAPQNFNPRSPCGERHTVWANVMLAHNKFQPTLPLRGATLASMFSASVSRFQPTLPMRGATPEQEQEPPKAEISTHAPHAGSDLLYDCPRHCRHLPISTHAPHTGSDGRADINACYRGHFNPRSPYGERPAG